MTTRPQCPTCAAPIDRMQRSYGVVCPYPCQDWLSPDDADQLAQRHRADRAAAEHDRSTP